MAVRGGEDQVSKFRHKSGQRRSLPVWTWGVALGVVLLSLLSFALYRHNRITESAAASAAPAAKSDAKTQSPQQKTAARLSEASEPPGAAAAPLDALSMREQFRPAALEMERSAPQKPAAGAPLEDVYSYLEHGIVLIEIFDESDTKLGIGSGFVIDRSGLVATNYHVVQSAARAEAVFPGEQRVAVEGYAGIAQDHDLAILKLRRMPADAVVLGIDYREEPRKLSEVVAIGHPENHVFAPFTGRVTRVVKTSELPDDSQEFLQYLGSRQDHVWIEHRTGIAPGNSGGPLIDVTGNVLGINTWVNKQLEVGYALHVQHLRQLRYSLLPSVEPLERYRVREETFLGRQLNEQFTLEKLEELYRRCADADWKAESGEQYHNLQHFAFLITCALAAHEFADPDDPDAERFGALAQRANEMVAEMLQVDWSRFAHVAAVNLHAEHAVRTPNSGVFLFGRVDGRVRFEGGRSGALVTIEGRNTKLVVPLDESVTLDRGTRCLILGINYATLPFNDERGTRPAHLILTRTLLEL